MIGNFYRNRPIKTKILFNILIKLIFIGLKIIKPVFDKLIMLLHKNYINNKGPFY